MANELSASFVVKVNIEAPVEEALPVLERLVQDCQTLLNAGMVNVSISTLERIILAGWKHEDTSVRSIATKDEETYGRRYSVPLSILEKLKKAAVEGRKIECIKIVRSITTMGLKEAKAVVDVAWGLVSNS